MESTQPPTLHYAPVRRRPRFPVAWLTLLFGGATLLGGAGWAGLYSVALNPYPDEFSLPILMIYALILTVWGELAFGLCLWLLRQRSAPSAMRWVVAFFSGLVYAMIPAVCSVLSDTKWIDPNSPLSVALVMSCVGAAPFTAAALTTSPRLAA